MTHAVDTWVLAARPLYDQQADGRSFLVARTGDRGRVEYVDTRGVPTVRFSRTGRAIDCLTHDISAVGAE